MGAPEDRIHALDIWRGPLEISAVAGGLTNRNYLVRDGSRRCIVRLGMDLPVHRISRANELAASRAAHAAGLSPAVVHFQPGILVLDYIDAPPLTTEAFSQPETLGRVVRLVREVHRQVGQHLRGPGGLFWVFHIIADYAASLERAGSAHRHLLPGLLDSLPGLEQSAGPFELVFGHNDLLPGNF
ncbi:MAG: phosphotransferase, partial [Rhizobium sp.]